MTFFEFLAHADAATTAAHLLGAPLLSIKYTGLFGLLVLLTGAVGLLLVRAHLKGTRVHRRAFPTLSGLALGLGLVGAHWGYVGVLQTLEQSPIFRPTPAQLASGAEQTWALIALGVIAAAAHLGAGAWVARRQPAPAA